MVSGEHPGSAALINKIDRPRSLTAIVIDQIRDMIVTGQLELGQQLSETAIAAQLGVSRTPVREAFLTLETESLVAVHPQRGTFVFDYDAKELQEICELRAVLETGALRIGLQQHRETVIEALVEQVANADSQLEHGPPHYQQFDTAFHETLVLLCNNRELSEAHLRISGRIRSVRYRLMRTPQQITTSQREHREVVSLLQAGEDVQAEAALVRHIYNGYRTFLANGRDKDITNPELVDGQAKGGAEL